MTEKIFVYDHPLVKTQTFKVSLPGQKGRIFVERKEVTRQQHNMGCTDGMKEGEVDIHVDYEVHQEVPRDVWQEAVNAVEAELEK